MDDNDYSAIQVIEIEGVDYAVETCGDVEDLMEIGKFVNCPVCGAMAKHGVISHVTFGVFQ